MQLPFKVGSVIVPLHTRTLRLFGESYSFFSCKNAASTERFERFISIVTILEKARHILKSVAIENKSIFWISIFLLTYL